MGATSARRQPVPRTIPSYAEAALQFDAWLDDEDLPVDVGLIERRHIEARLASLLDRWKPATAAARHRSLRQFFRWLEDDGELDVSPMTKMRPPQVPEQPVPILTDDQLGALLDACTGKGFVARRDTAIIRTLLDTGGRLSEIARLTLDDVDFNLDVLYVMGKGRSGRSVPFGRRTGMSLDRYLRARSPTRPRRQRVSLAWHARIHDTVRDRPDARAPQARPASVTCTHTSSVTRSRTPGSQRVAPRATSCAWPAGPAPRCCRATGCTGRAATLAALAHEYCPPGQLMVSHCSPNRTGPRKQAVALSLGGATRTRDARGSPPHRTRASAQGGRTAGPLAQACCSTPPGGALTTPDSSVRCWNHQVSCCFAWETSMSPEAHDPAGPPPVDFDGDPLLASLVQDVNTRDTEEGLSITLTVGGVLVSGKLGSRTAYNRACMWHLDQGAERDSAGVRAAFRADEASSAWPAYVHVQDVRFFDATGASVPRGRHWPSVWWRGRIQAVDGWTLGELRIDAREDQ